MSRAFVTENDSWEYCPKAGERCMLAENGIECQSDYCRHASKKMPETARDSVSKRDKFVRVERK